MIYFFTGDGKGKTTAAIGMGIRMAGAGKKVLLIRFLKANNTSSEEKVIKEIKKFDLKSFGRKGFFLPKEELEKNPELEKKGVKPLSKEDKELFIEGMNLAAEHASKKDYKLIILDEVFLGIRFGLIKTNDLLDFLKKYRDQEIVLTGRGCPSKILKFADLVTEMKEIKHPYQQGKKAKKGVEY